MATQVLTEQIKDIQQIVRTPRRITRSALAKAHENGNFIEDLPNTDLAEKCNDFIAKKISILGNHTSMKPTFYQFLMSL